MTVNGRFELDKTVRDSRTLAFGFGRRYAGSLCVPCSNRMKHHDCRVCPGRFLAEQSLFAIVSSVLACYSILPAHDEPGTVSALEIKLAPGVILSVCLSLTSVGFLMASKLCYRQPFPFKCTFKPRSARAADLIASALPDRGL